MAQLGVIPLGFDLSEPAVATARRAGHHRLIGDLTRLDPVAFAYLPVALREQHGDDRPADAASWVERILATPFDRMERVTGQISSPPCQGFSTAGKGEGRQDAALLLDAIRECRTSEDVAAAIKRLHAEMRDDRSVLVLEPLRWALALEPEWLAWEQVPAVMPIWQACADVLRHAGYVVEVARLSAEQYGVPQTRARAILVARSADLHARLGGRPLLPKPTHSRYFPHAPERLEEGVKPWVSMAAALDGYAGSLIGFPRRADSDDVVTIDGEDYRARDLRDADLPAQTVTEKSRSWQRYDHSAVRDPEQFTGMLSAGGNNTAGQVERPPSSPSATITGKGTAYWRLRSGNQDHSAVRTQDQPAATVLFGGRVNAVHWVPEFNDQTGTPYDPTWPEKRPATVVAGRGLVQNPGATANRHNGSTKSRNDGVRVTVAEAGVLQSFPASYPWQGTTTQQFQQVGDAVPPLLARAIVGAVTGLGS